MKTLFLVACCKTKLDHHAQAKDLYTSPWFKLARSYVESQPNSSWVILSAKFGFVWPDQELAPYDQTLSWESKQRHQWARFVGSQLAEHIRDIKPEKVVFLAGSRYSKYLACYLQKHTKDIALAFPLKGLFLGQQLQWLKAQVP